MKFNFHDEWFFFSKTGLFHTTEIDQYVNSCLDNTQSIIQTRTRNCVWGLCDTMSHGLKLYMKLTNTRNGIWYWIYLWKQRVQYSGFWTCQRSFSVNYRSARKRKLENFIILVIAQLYSSLKWSQYWQKIVR